MVAYILERNACLLPAYFAVTEIRKLYPEGKLPHWVMIWLITSCQLGFCAAQNKTTFLKQSSKLVSLKYGLVVIAAAAPWVLAQNWWHRFDLWPDVPTSWSSGWVWQRHSEWSKHVVIRFTGRAFCGASREEKTLEIADPCFLFVQAQLCKNIGVLSEFLCILLKRINCF